MHIFTKTICAFSLISTAAACGGSGGGSDPIEPFPLASANGTATVIQLDATALTTDEATGNWRSGAQEIRVGGEAFSAVSGSEVSDGLTFVRQVSGGSEGETLVYTPTLSENLPSGTATYSGNASVVITDASGSSVSYTLTGSSTAVANPGSGNLDVSFADLTGERTASEAGPQPFTTSGTVIFLDGLTLAGDGGIGVNTGTTATVAGVETVSMDANATVSAAGGIAGTSGQEIAGAAAVSDADTIMLTVFAGQQ